MRTAEDIYESLAAEVAPHLAELVRCGSMAELETHSVYRRLEPAIRQMLSTLEGGGGAPPCAARTRYRVLAWNIERGTQFEGQIEAFQSHPYLKTCDLLLLTEADLGMARSGNRHVARELAKELGFYYAFAPCYLNLTKGSGVEYETSGRNTLGLHGNAVLSRYPIGRVRRIPLRNGIDKMAGREKRIGCQTALAAEIAFPNLPLTAVSVHLDAQSTQRHRREQMRDVLASLEPGPAILGGDWNTSTYNSSHAVYAILGFWLRVMMGVDNVIRNHYLHPGRFFEKGLFAMLERHGFDYAACNQLGERTGCYSIADERAARSLGEWVPEWCFTFIRWALRNHGGLCPLKLDWFATRGLRAEAPVVIHDLREGRQAPLSDHDAIGVDLTA